MKKIKTKITNVYNRYLFLISKKTLSFFNHLKFSKDIKIKTSAFNQYLSITSKKILFFIIRLKFMKNSKVKISVFNRYLILLIVILFSSLFYLSAPVLYNYGDLQKELTKKLKLISRISRKEADKQIEPVVKEFNKKLKEQTKQRKSIKKNYEKEQLT